MTELPLPGGRPGGAGSRGPPRPRPRADRAPLAGGKLDGGRPRPTAARGYPATPFAIGARRGYPPGVPLDARTRLLLVLTATFVVCLVVGDLVGGKLVTVVPGALPVTVSVGMIPFPITFLLTDLLHEFYGRQVARLVTFVGLGMALLTYAVVFAAGALPIAELTRAPGFPGVTEDAFQRVFLASQRIIVGSLTAYLLAQLLDIAVFHALKRSTGARLLWLRATGSTALSQLVDTVVISVIAWWGILSPGAVLGVALSSYAIKLVVAVALTPAVYAGHALIERWAGMEPVPVERTS